MLLIGFRHRHPGALLYVDLAAALHHRHRQNGIVDGSCLIIQHHLIREIGSRGRGTCIGQHIPGLHIVRAEFADAGKITVDKGHIIVFPQSAQSVFVRLKGHFAVLYVKNIKSHLLHADDKIVGHGIPPVKGFAVVRHIRGLGICPLIIALRHLGHTLCGGKLIDSSARSLGKRLPVGHVHHHDLGGFRHREQIKAAVIAKIAFLHVGIHIFR